MAGRGNYTITGDSPTTIIFPSLDRDMFLVNTGDEVIYLGASAADCTATTGMPLAVAATKQWIRGDECYAIMEPGKTGKLNVSDNPGNLFDPSAIARRIYVSGTPPVDKYTDILTAVANPGYLGSAIDVSGYNSLYVTLYNATPSARGELEIKWETSNGTHLGSQRFGVTGGSLAGGSSTFLSVPVRGPFVVFNYYDNGGTTTCTILGFASYKEVEKPTFFGYGAGTATGTVHDTMEVGYQSWAGTVPAATAWDWEPDVIAGPVRVNFRVTSGSSTVSTFFRTADNVFNVFAERSAFAVTGAYAEIYEFYMPPYPIEVVINNTGAAAVTFRFTIDYGNPFQ